MGYEKITELKDLFRFNLKMEEHIGFLYPKEYLQKANIWIYRKNGEIVAGFMLYPYQGSVRKFRCISQMPIFRQLDAFQKLIRLGMVPRYAISAKDYGHEFFEYGGYFISDKSIGVYFTLRMILSVIFSRGIYFFYSYSYYNKKLGHYYSKGKPIRLYSGPVTYLDIYENEHTDSENVEVLTKWGIVRIFLWRCYQIILKYIKPRTNDIK